MTEFKSFYKTQTQAVKFNGTTNIAYTETAEDVFLSKQISFSFWVYPGIARTEYPLSITDFPDITTVGTITHTIGIDYIDGLSINFEDSSGAFESGVSVAPLNLPLPGNQWTCIMVSIDAENDITQIYYNNSRITNYRKRIVKNVLLDGTGCYIRQAFLNDTNSDSHFSGHLANFWFDDTFIDFTIEENRRKFLTSSGRPAELGNTGQVPTGTTPVIFFDGYLRDWNNGVNKGTTGDLFVKAPMTKSTQLPVQLP